MITILKEENKEALNAFLKEQNTTICMDNMIVMSAKDKDEILAVGALCMKDYKVYLDHIVLKDTYREDLNLSLGILKSLLNLADLRGIKTVYGSNPDMERFYKMLRFQKENDTYTLSLEGYFTCEH